MTDCPRADIRDMLPDWVHGTLGAASAAAVSIHLAGCAECAAEAELLRVARAALGRAPHIDVGRIAAAVHATRAEGRRARPRWPAVAGILAVAAGVAVVMFGGAGETPDRGTMAVAVDSASETPAVVIDSGNSRKLTIVDTSHSVVTGGTERLAGGDARPQLVMGGGLGDLGDQELEALLGALDRVDAVPSASPEPVVTSPVVTSLTERLL